MAFSVQMPALGESVTEGTVTRWLKQEGEQVEVDEPLLEVSTDKVDTEIPSPAAGVLQRIVVHEDETVEVGAELAVIGDGPSSGDPDGSAGTSNGSATEPPASEPANQASASEPAGSAGPAESAASPSQPAGRPEPAQASPRPSPGLRTAPAPDEPPAASSGSPAAAAPAPAAPPAATEPTKGSAEGTAVTMPALGESVTEGTVTRWLKQVGDYVAIDEPLLEVSTDKVDTEIPSPVAGVLLEITAGEEQVVDVGGRLALIAATSGAAAASQAGAQAEPAESPGAPAVQPGPAAAGGPDIGPDRDAADAPAPAQAETRQPETRQPEARQTPEPAARPSDAHEPDTGARTPSADGDGSGPYVTPLVRKLAAEHDVDLDTVSGTGVGGRIRKQDVLAAADRNAAERGAADQAAADSSAATRAATDRAGAEPARMRPRATPPAPSLEPSAEAAALRGTTEKLSRLRTVIAQRMVESLQVSAQLTAVVEVDVTRVARLRTAARKDFETREGVKLTFLPFFAKAAVEALKQHPKLNASIDMERGEVTYHGAEHLAIAVDTERGLIVPVIHDAGDLSIAGLARKIADLAERTRTNKVKPDELAGGTFTLTNIGSRGSLLDTPIINQPQVGILGTGAVVKRPVVVSEPDGDTIAIRSMAYLVLSYDHRLVDGADAARFLSTVKQRIEHGGFADDLAV